MTSKEDPFRSITGVLETSEPRDGHGDGTSASNPMPSGSHSQQANVSSSGAETRPAHLTSSRSNLSVSPAASPNSSREPSPARPNPRTSGMSTAASKGSRSRKNSADSKSPSRPPSVTGLNSTTPSAAAIQRALSSSTTPQLQPSSSTDTASKLPRAPQRTSTAEANQGISAPRGSGSSRIQSPPPAGKGTRRNSLLAQAQRNAEQQQQTPQQGVAPSIVVQDPTPSSTPTSSTSIPARDTNEGTKKEMEQQQPQPKPRFPAEPAKRGSSAAQRLETVPESKHIEEHEPNGLQSTTSRTQMGKTSDEDKPVVNPEDSKTTKASESGSDSGGTKHDTRGRTQDPKANTSATRPKTVTNKASYSSLVPVKSRTQTEANRMTVETETVSSIPQSTISSTQSERSAAARNDGSGSLRMKPSSETIRPKKDRKKAKKAPSITSGTASSRADLFEAKVASKVGEANSSDSDETFVYESNPPDVSERPNRHHSRTPSTTSMASLADPRGPVRSMASILSERSVGGKRSMKFANNPYNDHSADDDANDHHDGTVRAKSGTGSAHHHHIGRYGLNSPANHIQSPQMFEHDSPFSQASRRGKTSRHSSRPNSPRVPNQNLRLATPSIKKNGEYSAYDIEGGDGLADSEETPLLGTVKTPRTPRTPRTPKRPLSASLRQMEWEELRRRRSWVRRFAGCIIMTIMLLLLIFGAIGLLFVTTKPLYHVGVREIQNVLASKQEIMLDLLVEAINPNIIAVSVTDMDVNIFAKSKHVQSEKWWREHGPLPSPEWDSGHRRLRPLPHSGDDDSVHTSGFPWDWDDPSEDPANDAQTMLLGRIFHFDSALSFDGSPIKRHPHFSAGELRLAKPGNKTEAGGTERWERVIQFPFELIVRGILKYSLPLSGHVRTAPIGASVVVHPDKGVDKHGRMVVTQVKHAYNWSDPAPDSDDEAFERWKKQYFKHAPLPVAPADVFSST